MERRLQVDGAEVRFSHVRDGADWAAHAAVADDHELRVLGHGVPPEAVALVSVADAEPFFDGWRRFLAAK